MNKHYNKTIFQGKDLDVTDSYFEGWYFKQVNHYSSYTISFIPGISYNKKDPHCFIQIIILNNENKLFTFYFRYKIDDFIAKESPFLVKIKDNIFREDFIKINIEEPELRIFGELKYTKLKGLKKTFFQPNIMGFFSYFPKNECNHHIVSVEHEVSGTLVINNKIVDFEKGKGYIEKDWGTSFPKEYIWLQCNNFDHSKELQLTFSYATIPYLNFSFKGFFISLFIGDKEYRFATYNFSKIKKIKIYNNSFEVFIKKRNIEVSIKASFDKSRELFSPKKGEMKNKIKEGLKGEIELSFKDYKNNIAVFSKGKDAGIEIMMNNKQNL